MTRDDARDHWCDHWRDSWRDRTRWPAGTWGRAAVGVALCVALSGCGTGTSAESAPAGAAVADMAQAQSAQGGTADADRAAAGNAEAEAAGAADPAAATDRKIARTATMTVTVENLDAAGQAVRAAATAVGGEVTDERWDLRAGEAGQGALTLSVPAAGLQATLTRLEGLGTVTTREANATDVTGTYVDTQGRLTTMRASIARVRALMDDATSVRDVIELEKALASREAELEALERRMAALTGSVENATITLTLLGPKAPAATGGGNGFTDGLQRGLNALITSAAVALTVFGILLPWLVPLALLAAGVAWIVRRRRAKRADQARSGATAATSTDDATAAEATAAERADPKADDSADDSAGDAVKTQ